MTKPEFKKVKSLLTWVKKMITLHPENYDQTNWCGTRCCIAGWIDVKVNGAEVHARHTPSEVFDNACKALGLDNSRDYAMFEAGSAGPTCFRGTAQHAEAGCAAIDNFLAEQEAEVTA